MTAAPQWDFVTLHGRMLALYRLAAQDGPTARAQIEPRLPALRSSPAATGSGTGLLCYESYLDLIALHLADPALHARHSLLDRQRFEAELRADPSRSLARFATALCLRRDGEAGAARRLLRHLAASRYPEQSLARQILARDVERAAMA
jgi:hypothetical protein